MRPLRPMRWLAPLAMLALVACGTPHRADTTTDGQTLDDYAAAIDRHNRRTDRIEQLWARAAVEIEWTDHRDRRRFEQGDGPLIYRAPHELALAIGKYGRTLYWLGADEDRYWLFDLNPPDDEPTTAHVGRHANLGRPCSDALPIPLRLGDLARLAGLAPLPTPDQARVEPDGDAWRVTPPDGEGPTLRVAVEPGQPGAARVELLGPDDRPLAIAALSRWRALEIDGVPPGGWPDIPTHIAIELPDENATVTLYLESQTDGRRAGRVHDAQFDFDGLVEAHRPGRLVALDANCPEPAIVD